MIMMKSMRCQSAIEYLITYSWSILIVALAIAALFMLGIFNPIPNTECILPAGLECTGATILPNGIVTINLLQVTSSPINVTALGCNSNSIVANMQKPLNPPTNQIKLQIGSNYTFSAQCYSGSSAFSGTIGSVFRGYIYVNYTEMNTGFPHTAPGQIIVKVT
jgi:hypothetical protein